MKEEFEIEFTEAYVKPIFTAKYKLQCIVGNEEVIRICDVVEYIKTLGIEVSKEDIIKWKTNEK